MLNTFESPRLKIRPATIHDTDTFLRWWSDGSVMVHVGFPQGLNLTRDKVEETLSLSKTSQNPNQSRVFVMIDTLLHHPIGELSYKQLDLENSTVTIGIKICEPAYQGQGYGKEALCAFFHQLFMTFNLVDIKIDTLATNTRAMALYEKVGARRTEVRKQYWTNPEGTVFDAVFYRLNQLDFYAFCRSDADVKLFIIKN